MNSELRQIKIYDVIKNEQDVSVASLADRFHVSSMTIRRVLSKLEESKLIERSYGKAHIIDTSKTETSFATRQTFNIVAKEKIANLAIQFLLDKKIKSIYLDGSTTAAVLAKAIPQDVALTVFTNSAAVLQVLLHKPWLRTFVIGGFLDCDTYALNDISTEDQCKQIFVDATFTSCGGFSAMGMFNNGFTGAQIRRILMKNSARNFLLVDHTKFDSHGIFLLNTWDMVDVLITDEELPRSLLQILREKNVQIVFPGPTAAETSDR